MDILGLDEQLFLYLNNLGTPTWDRFWLTITNKLFWIPLYLLFVYFIFIKVGYRHAILVILSAALMIGVADQVSHTFKDILIQRLRPCKNPEVFALMRLVKESCGGKFGFFSGHATNHMALAIFLGLMFQDKKWILPLLIIWAFFVAYSRVYIGVHYPLDILTGMLMGGLIGYFFYQLQAYIYHRLNKDKPILKD